VCFSHLEFRCILNLKWQMAKPHIEAPTTLRSGNLQKHFGAEIRPKRNPLYVPRPYGRGIPRRRIKSCNLCRYSAFRFGFDICDLRFAMIFGWSPRAHARGNFYLVLIKATPCVALLTTLRPDFVGTTEWLPFSHSSTALRLWLYAK